MTTLRAAASAAMDKMIETYGLRASVRDYPPECPLVRAWHFAERAADAEEKEPTLGELYRRAYGSDENVNAVYDALYGSR